MNTDPPPPKAMKISKVGVVDTKKTGCVCTCCHVSNLDRRECVVFLIRNYAMTIPYVAQALSHRHREQSCKEFICKQCHAKLKVGIKSIESAPIGNNRVTAVASTLECQNTNAMGVPVSKSDNSYGHNVVKESSNVVQNSNSQNANQIAQTSPIPPPQSAPNNVGFHTSIEIVKGLNDNKCVCTCCHITDMNRQKCIIFKESRYNMGNFTVQKALQYRYHYPTAKEFICKKCDKSLLKYKLPSESVCSPTKKCIIDKECVVCKEYRSGQMQIFQW